MVIQMKWHPCIFGGGMVLAIIDGAKTQTRRLISPENSLLDGAGVPRKGRRREIWDGLDWVNAVVDDGKLKVEFPGDGTVHRVYPKWEVGDKLWVRESVEARNEEWCSLMYLADSHCEECGAEEYASLREWPRVTPAIHMPRWASRIFLEVTAIWPERLHAMKFCNEDAIAEGAHWKDFGKRIYNQQRDGWSMLWPHPGESDLCLGAPWTAFANYWDSIYAKRGHGWDKNELVWVCTFKRVKA